MEKVERKYNCEDCSSTFPHRRHLHRHKLKCQTQVTFCKSCSKSYSRHDTLKLRKCSNQKQIENCCSVCEKHFKKKKKKKKRRI